MSPSIPAFRPLDATRQSFWGNNSFSIWVTDDALCGLHNHKRGPSSGAWPVDLLPLTFEGGLWGLGLCLIAVILFIPFAIALSALSEHRQQKAQDQLDELDPTSQEYLMWDSKNFSLDLSGIERAEFFEPTVRISSATPTQQMRLHLETGEKWHFTLATRQDVEELQSLLDQRSIPTTRSYSQSLTSYLTAIFGGP